MTAQAARTVRSFAVPRTVEEALDTRRDLGSDAVFLAGGTDLGVAMRRSTTRPHHLIDLSRLDELRSLELNNGEIVVGAGVTHRTIELSDLFDGPAAALREACATVGSIQTRTVGTVGGNLCNASPASDTAPVLLALGASVEIAGPGGRRVIPLDQFFVGYRLTALDPGELLVSIRIPAPGTPRGSAFIKLGRRAAMEISIVCVAVRIDMGDDGAIASAGVGLGSVAATPVRSRHAEDALVGSPSEPTTWSGAGVAALADCDPIDDVRATGEYRRAMLPVLFARGASLAAERAGGTG